MREYRAIEPAVFFYFTKILKLDPFLS